MVVESNCLHLVQAVNQQSNCQSYARLIVEDC